MEPFSLYQLRIFQTVAEEGAISRAAERLYLTQPAVSQHIHALEIHLGAQLFQRGRRGVTLTPAGKVLLDYSRRILELTAEAQQAVALASGARTGVVRLGASPGVGPCLMPEWIGAFHALHPTINVTLRTAPTPRIIRALQERRIDLGIVEGEVHDSTVQTIPLWDEEIVIVVGPGHPWWGQERVHAQELDQQPFVAREQGSLTRAWEERTLEEFGVHPNVVAEFDTPIAIKQAVASGLGIALLPQFAVQRELETGRLHGVKLAEGRLERTLKILWAPHCLKNPAVHAFLYHLSVEFPHIAVQIAQHQEEAREQSRPQELPTPDAP